MLYLEPALNSEETGRRDASQSDREVRTTDGLARSSGLVALPKPLTLQPTADILPFNFVVTRGKRRLYFPVLGRPYRLAVRTLPFHGGSRGSIPLRVATFHNLPRGAP